ncbi:hypothetical protein ACHAXT_006733 [Thalassiosira profunda]
MLSSQVLSSPFDAPQRPRTAPSRQNGDRKRVKETGSSLGRPSNIMVDARVIRRSILANKTNASNEANGHQQGCVLFDSRLIKGDVFANPIVTVPPGITEKRSGKPAGRSPECRQIATPPPVTGRLHVSVQTDVS